jgi:hypothetical protein
MTTKRRTKSKTPSSATVSKKLAKINGLLNTFTPDDSIEKIRALLKCEEKLIKYKVVAAKIKSLA